MTKSDRNKLTRAGFTLLRVCENELKIKRMTGDHSWANHAKFDTKAALKREIDRINEDETMMIFEYS